MSFGGGGALHTGALIKEVGLQSALVPRYPGVTSALGCVVADMRHDRVRTVNRLLDEIDMEALATEIAGTARSAEELIRSSGVNFSAIDIEVEFDMLYVGQTHSVSVPVATGRIDRKSIAVGLRCRLSRFLWTVAGRHSAPSDESPGRGHRAAAGAGYVGPCRRERQSG